VLSNAALSKGATNCVTFQAVYGNLSSILGKLQVMEAADNRSAISSKRSRTEHLGNVSM
jgi:hypothetical protein